MRSQFLKCGEAASGVKSLRRNRRIRKRQGQGLVVVGSYLSRDLFKLIFLQELALVFQVRKALGGCLVLTNTRFPRTSNSTLLSPVISSRSNGGFTHSAGISTGKVKAAASATSEDGSRWNVANCSLSDSVQPRDPLDKETRQARLKRRIRGSG